jgi:adenosylmethionine-8-amino-7-oxononanoate aminotransferase
MGNVFYRNPLHDYPTAMRGEGVYLYDAEGRQYLDGSGGAAVSCLGHGHPAVVAAIKTQLDQLAFAHTAFFTNEPQEKLATKLVRLFGEADAKVYFVSGGSEANETALKLARQYWVARGKNDKHIMISRKQSYHGNTLGALSLSGNPGRNAVYRPILHDWPKIEPCYAYRHQQANETVEEYGLRCAAELEAAIQTFGADNIAAFFAETVVGATLGAVPAAGRYFQRIREICDRHDVLLVLDEVMAGGGRSGSYFAFEQEGIVPDIVTVAKGLGGGYQPIGAAISRGHIHEQIVDAFGSFAHGHTYVGHATACAAGLAVTQVIESDNLLTRVKKTGRTLRAALGKVFADHPHVGDIRGRGLLLGIELVEDRETKAPIKAELGLPEKIRTTAMRNGLVCYPGGGTADGCDGAHVLLAPPYIYKSQHIDELIDKLQRTLDAVIFRK